MMSTIQVIWSAFSVGIATVQLASVCAILFWLRKGYARKRLAPPPAATKTALDIVISRFAGELERTNNLMCEESIMLRNAAEQYPRPKTENRDFLVLPVYYKFLVLQLLHCALWVGMCLWLVATNRNLVEWGETANDKGGIEFVATTAVIMGIHAAFMDGVLFFLSRKSIGADAISKSAWFATCWGIFVAILCASISGTFGKKSNKDSLIFNQHPWWDPFFIRVCTFFIFSVTLLIYPFRKKYRRNSWRKLARYNAAHSFFLIALYILDFYYADGTMGTVWATALIISFFLFFLLNTPMYYLALINDSTFWRDTWRERIAELPSPQWMEASSPRDPETSVNGSGNDVGSSSNMGTQEMSPLLDFSAFTYHRVIGVGGFASVWRGSLWSVLPVAIKVLHVKELCIEDVDRFLHEVKMLANCQHPNVVRLIGACLDPPDLAIATELCGELSLYQRIRNHMRVVCRTANKQTEGESRAPKRPAGFRFDLAVGDALPVLFCLSEAIDILLAISRAVTFMHARGIIHRDLKSANVLFDFHDQTPKVCDFGMALLEEAVKNDDTKICGTPGYIAPEVLRFEPHSFASDMFAFGLITWEVLCSRLVWRDKDGALVCDTPQLMDRIAYHKLRPPVALLQPETAPEDLGNYRNVPKRLIDFVVSTWEEAEFRPSFAQAVELLESLQQEI